MAQSVIAVMAQDFVYVRRELQGLSVRSVYPAICGTMAANVSRTITPYLPTPPAAAHCPPFSSVSLRLWFLSLGWKHVSDMQTKHRACVINVTSAGVLCGSAAWKDACCSQPATQLLYVTCQQQLSQYWLLDRRSVCVAIRPLIVQANVIQHQHSQVIWSCFNVCCALCVCTSHFAVTSYSGFFRPNCRDEVIALVLD